MPELVDVSSLLQLHSELPRDTSAPPIIPLVEYSGLPSRTVESQVDSDLTLPLDIVSNPLVDESETPTEVDQTTVESVEIEDVEVVGDHTSLEDAVETAAPFTEAVEEEVSMNNTTSPTFVKTIVSPATKPGKQPIGAIKRIIEAKLSPGEQVKRKALAVLIGKTSEAVRQRKENKTLNEWGIRLVPDSETELFERI